MRRFVFSALLVLAYTTVPAAAIPDMALPEAVAAEVAAAPQVVAQEPAVEVPEQAEAEEEQPWTARYLIPTLLAISALVLLVVGVSYGVRLRGRYRVVQ